MRAGASTAPDCQTVAMDTAVESLPDATDARGRAILLAGGTSTAGLVVAATLVDAGARVVVVGRDSEKLARLAAEVPGVVTLAADLTDETAVAELTDRVHEAVGPIDGVLHLVGGWRGGGGLAGQSDDDFRVLERSLTALRHVSRAFDPDLRASPAARFAIVSSPAVVHPLAGGANYATVKAASETWTRAVGQGYAKDARDRGVALQAAAVIFRVRSLTGLEGALGDAFTALWDDDADEWNGVVLSLEPPSD